MRGFYDHIFYRWERLLQGNLEALCSNHCPIIKKIFHVASQKGSHRIAMVLASFSVCYFYTC